MAKKIGQKRKLVKKTRLEWPRELADAHARMRARDLERIASGEATPEEIQEENSLFGKPKSWRLPKLTI